MKKQNNNAQSESKFNVTFGVCGYDAVPANAAVLVAEGTVYVQGNDGKKERKSVVKFLAVEGVKSTKNTDVIVPLLSVMLADVRERAGFASEFKVCVLNGEKTDSKIRAKSLFTKWLKGNVIYKSNASGELTRALVLDEGLKLSGTSLKVSEKQPIFEAKGNELRVLMHQTANAIAKQATMLGNTLKQAKAIFNCAYDAQGKAKAVEKKET